MKSGCKKHSDCFTCPFPDCVWNSVGDEPRTGKKISDKRSQHMREWYQKKKHPADSTRRALRKYYCIIIMHRKGFVNV